MVSTNKRVLVVDDEEIVRDSCRRVLTDAGYEVHVVSSGRDALSACRNQPVDVMLTDIRMPDMDGIQVARAIRREFPDVRVLIITGYPSRQSAEQAERLGIFDYLEKPLSPSRLSAATAAALASPPRPVPRKTPDPEQLPAGRPSSGTEGESSEPSASVTESTVTNAARLACPSVGETVAATHPSAIPAESSDRPASDTPARQAGSPMKTLALMAVSPLLGLAFVVFLPLIGFGMLFAALGSGLVGKSRSAQA